MLERSKPRRRGRKEKKQKREAIETDLEEWRKSEE